MLVAGQDDGLVFGQGAGGRRGAQVLFLKPATDLQWRQWAEQVIGLAGMHQHAVGVDAKQGPGSAADVFPQAVDFRLHATGQLQVLLGQWLQVIIGLCLPAIRRLHAGRPRAHPGVYDGIGQQVCRQVFAFSKALPGNGQALLIGGHSGIHRDTCVKCGGMPSGPGGLTAAFGYTPVLFSVKPRTAARREG
ncbi:hypothetical protein D3C72_1801080 [compost metagenome]